MLHQFAGLLIAYALIAVVVVFAWFGRYQGEAL